MYLQNFKFLHKILSQRLPNTTYLPNIRTYSCKKGGKKDPCPPRKPYSPPKAQSSTPGEPCCPTDCPCRTPTPPCPCKPCGPKADAPASPPKPYKCPPKPICPPSGSRKPTKTPAAEPCCPPDCPCRTATPPCPCPPTSPKPACAKRSICPPKPEKSFCPPKPALSCPPSTAKKAPPVPPCPCPCPPKPCGPSESAAVKGKVALITGGSVGIGFECARAILRNGGKVMLGDVKVNEGKDAICKIIDEFGYNKAAFMKCDVTLEKDMNCLFNAALCEFKQVDIVINNAGILKDQYWDKCIDINVKGVIRGTLLGFKHMRQNRDGGTIVNVASILGHQPCFPCPVYCGTKHFVVGFSRSMGTDYFFCQTGVKVMTLCPGVTITSMVVDSEKAGQLQGFGDTGKQLHDELYKMPTQPGDVCGGHLIPILEAGINGSDWISEDSEVYRVKQVDRKTLKIC